ncbi:MAG: tryptophan synthase subunit alpha [Candidatus Omnitrophota bacterium]
MNRIDGVFKKLKRDKKKAFITYVTAGDPNIKTSEEIILTLAKNGADIIELGIPFSDPLADGPTIQKAIQRSLDKGCSVKKVLAMVKRMRGKTDVPFVFMTYYNIIFNYGPGKFVKDAKASGADGIIIPDLPMEESGEMKRCAKKEDFCLIMLTAPTTPGERFRKIASESQGFVYHVSLTGVTGERKTLQSRLGEDVKRFKKLTSKPLCVGFGISTPEQAGKVSKVSDGVIVGSAIIKIIEKNIKTKQVMIHKIGSLARSLGKAVHG